MSIQLAFRGGRLSLLEPVGSGATSTVWRARLSSADGKWVDHPVAVKVARTTADRALLAAEAERLIWSNSYASARLIDAGRIRRTSNAGEVAPDAACLVLSWVGAQSLEQQSVQDDQDAAARALHLARDIGEALGDLHQAGFSHGDVKPANIVIQEGASIGSVGRFVLVDMGLSDSADTPMPRGATPRYLAPEVLNPTAKGDGRTRDIWALGVVLVDTARGHGQARGIVSAASADGLEEPLRTLIRAGLAPSPGARPSARWFARRAQAALNQSLSPDDSRSRRIRRLRRAYLQARRNDIIAVARAQSVQIEFDGPAEQWLRDTVSQLRGLFELRGEPLLDCPATLQRSSPLDRQRIITNLVGPVAASWPVQASQSEAAWIEQWLKLCDATDESGWTLAQTSPTSTPLGSPRELADLTSVALELGRERHDPQLLDAAEHLATTVAVPDAFRIAVAHRLRAAGEWGRALIFVG